MSVAIGNLRLTLVSLCQALDSPDLARRLEAIGSLAFLGCKARRAIPGLIESLSDPRVTVRKSATLALGEIGSREVIAPLRRVLGDTDASVRRCAGLALMNIGAESTCVAA
jgi:HEAT repeat protein